MQLGLTATPKRKDNVDTYAYFGEPVYVYSLKEGINDGFLTPFRVRQVSTTLDEYVYTSDDTVVEGEVEMGRRYEEIIGRGTRLFEGKDYFTIYDFVKAHHHFPDEEWDGPPLEEQPCPRCGVRPCVCERVEPKTCPDCGQRLCVCPKERCEICGKVNCTCNRKRRIKVKLADGKERAIQHMMVTTFWHPDGTPMSAAQFMEMLFGRLPEFFKDEGELWSAPGTRAKLLAGLAEKGFGPAQLSEMQKLIDAEKSDLFDVLAYVAYQLPPLTRQERATRASTAIATHFNDKERAFVEFVLGQYVAVGVEELGADKLTPLLRLKYNNAIADALADLGKPEQIQTVFAGFQQYLYASGA